MLEILQFICSGFWVFIGCCILLGMVCSALHHMFHVNINVIRKDK